MVIDLQEEFVMLDGLLEEMSRRRINTNVLWKTVEKRKNQKQKKANTQI